jgi:hypothetical protein
LENRDKVIDKSRKYASNNFDKVSSNKKRYRKENQHKIKSKFYERLSTDSSFRIQFLLRNRLRNALKKYTKTGKVMPSKKYGVDYQAIIENLKPFPEDLSKYHIDHIKPLCSFRFVNEDGSTNLEEIKKAFAPENHQWLTIEENLKKISFDRKLSVYKKIEN